MGIDLGTLGKKPQPAIGVGGHHRLGDVEQSLDKFGAAVTPRTEYIHNKGRHAHL
jgi:hypothetical protein